VVCLNYSNIYKTQEALTESNQARLPSRQLSFQLQRVSTSHSHRYTISLAITMTMGRQWGFPSPQSFDRHPYMVREQIYDRP